MGGEPVVVIEYQDVNAFLSAAGASLEASEAENNSFLGALAALEPERSATDPTTCLVAVVDKDGLPVLCAIALPGRNLVFSAAVRARRRAAALLASHLYTKGLKPPGLMAEQTIATEFRDAWAEITRCGVKESMRQGLYLILDRRYVDGGQFAAPQREAKSAASRRSVFTRSEGLRGISPGAATSALTPISVNWRYSPKPKQPAS
jgi:hypothetical protein